MKETNKAAIQYSGYPLSVAERKLSKGTPAPIIFIRLDVQDQTTFIQKNKISNDPKNWDLEWFNGYE